MSASKNIAHVLGQIQAKLKAPKGQYNKFGNYSYRSCEDIVEAVKPLLAEHDAALTISDEIVQIGDRFYVKATATMWLGDKIFESCAYARESLSAKGMSEAQITGATSSYARKYALNGLLAIDDTKDADSKDNREDGQMNGEKIDAGKIARLVDEAIAIIDDPDNDMQIGHDRVHKLMHDLTNDEKIAFNGELKERKFVNESTGREKSYASAFKEYWIYEGEMQ